MLSDLESYDIPLDVKITELQPYIEKLMNKENQKSKKNRQKVDYELKFKGLNIFRSYKISHHIVTPEQENVPVYKLYNVEVDIPKNKPEIVFNNSEIKFKKANISINFMKTVKVGNHIDKTLELPPEMKKAELYKFNNGMINIPLHQSEALILGISVDAFDKFVPVAIKIYWNGINVITGVHKKYDNEIAQTPQNYLICPYQTWIDGIIINNSTKDNYAIINNINQFTAQKIDKNISMETKLINEDIGNILEFEVFNIYKKNIKCYNFTKNKFINVNNFADVNDKLIFYEKYDTSLDFFNYTLADYGIIKSDNIEIIEIPYSAHIMIKDLGGKCRSIILENDMSVKRLKKKIQYTIGVPYWFQRLIFGGKQLNEDKLLLDYGISEYSLIHLVGRLRGPESRKYSNMNVLSEGIYQQKIIIDKNSQDWNTMICETYKFNIINSVQHIGKMPKRFEWNELCSEYNTEPDVVNDKKLICDIKKRIYYVKYITFKISIMRDPLLNILCGDVLNNIFDKVVNLYRI